MKRLLRPNVAMDRLGVGHTKFYKDIVGTGRLRLVRLGLRARGVVEDEVDALIKELMAERDAPKTKRRQRKAARA